ncbi:Membrane protein involved in the export of O-antigen and teichoic acid [Granulicella rosea]|uniref:Membrane protein involved in the export of O-antigen and teichoic acid n=1 Tax=Granulicella rosea TaxID=474952 RepID=A0A239LDF2_9BACT|nr:hypothetical protein [Granulicella rosea]SNT27873.1 Membrane protein involved in the export of O-antigen and teichoic acid [Granulicella rosea]
MPLDPSQTVELNEENISLAEPPRYAGTRWTRGKRVLQIVTNFFLGQGALQGLGILGGLIMVRRLSVEAYAQVGLATGFQALVATLMDLGFASTIIPLVGAQHGDRRLVGRYVRAAKRLRDRSFFILGPLAGLCFIAMMHKHHWGWPIQTILVASVLAYLYSGGKLSYHAAPLFLYGKLREFYVPQVIPALLRVGAFLALATAGWLNAGAATALTALALVASAELIAKKSEPYLVWPAKDDRATEREIVRYVMPAAPAMIFSAFQSQISLFLVSIFGSTVDLAQIAALGRIGGLFAIFTIFNVTVVEPYIARLERGRVLRNFIGLFSIATLGSIPVVALAFLRPQFYLWILGAKYRDLGPDLGWLIFGACINYLAGLLWIMNRARKWLFWSGTALEIGLVVAVQGVYLAFFGVRTVRQAVLFTFSCSFCYLVAHAYVTVLGFVKGAPIEAAGRAQEVGSSL